MVARRGKIKGVHVFRRRLAGGRVVEYHRVRGLRGSLFWKTGDDCAPGSPEYERRFLAARSGEHPLAAKTQSPATFGGIITAFYASADFAALGARTRADYRLWGDRAREKFGTAPKGAFERPEIRAVAMALRDQWRGKQAHQAWAVLRRVVSWAYKRGLLDAHHFRDGGKVYHRTRRAEIVWTPDERAAIEKAAPDWVRRAFIGACETGLRPGDLVRLSRAHIEASPRGRAIRIRTGKRGRMAVVPVSPAMAGVIDETPPGRLLIFTTEAGRPIDPGYLSRKVKEIRRACELREDLRLYDCRGTAASALLHAGASLNQIAVAMGWSLHYAQGVIEDYAATLSDPDAVLDLLLRARAKAETGTKL